MHLVESYGSTEAGPILIDGQVRRPPVTTSSSPMCPIGATSTPTDRTPEVSC
jgi:hypothetical protein